MIEYRKGNIFKDAERYAEETINNIIIAHICNNIGKWGKGFTAALDHLWDKPRYQYLDAKQYKYEQQTFLVHVGFHLYVANMIAQKGLRSKKNLRAVQFDWLAECLKSLQYQLTPKSLVYMPKIGIGLGGGDWNIIENLIKQHIKNPVFVYTL